jgi:drug/metabolite transporter (DMT)-like permease
MFTAVTVLLALALLGERLAPWQWIGLALTLMGVAVIASG